MAALLGGGKNLKNSLGIVVDWFFKCKMSGVLGRFPPSTTTRSNETVKLITREENPVVGWLVGW
jgi:hypothetical protein